MPIKLTGPINFTDIRNEFGPVGVDSMSLDDYRRGGNFVPNKNINSNIPLAGTSDPISLEDFYGATRVIELTFKAYGGGGAGGSGFENNGTGAGGGSGQSTGIMLKSKFDALKSANGGVMPRSISTFDFLPVLAGGYAKKVGAPGGRSGIFTTANATAGAASDFGAGGAAGPRNAAGSSPAWGNWAAGGGGGGGDQGNGDTYFIIFNRGGADEWGAAGEGGNDSAPNTGVIDMDIDVDYVVRLGAGGYPAVSVGQHDGGYGNPGYLSFTIDTAAGQTYVVEPVGTGTNADRNKEHYKGFRIRMNGTPEFFNV